MRVSILILNILSAVSFVSTAAVAASPWIVYPKAEEAFQVEIELPQGQTTLALNKVSELIATVKTPYSAKNVTISQLDSDARMPEHNHGMMTKPPSGHRDPKDPF